MDDLLAALCLVLVIEGLLPFASPKTWRSMIRDLGELSDRKLRIAGLISIVTGLLLLQWVR